MKDSNMQFDEERKAVKPMCYVGFTMPPFDAFNIKNESSKLVFKQLLSLRSSA